jgi:hypothetical protein
MNNLLLWNPNTKGNYFIILNFYFYFPLQYYNYGINLQSPLLIYNVLFYFNTKFFYIL